MYHVFIRKEGSRWEEEQVQRSRGSKSLEGMGNSKDPNVVEKGRRGHQRNSGSVSYIGAPEQLFKFGSFVE